MAADDDLYEDEDEEADGESGADPARPAEKASGLRNWLDARRGLLLILAITLLNGIFAFVMIRMRANARPMAETSVAEIRGLAVDMLGHEVDIRQIYQVVPVRGGRKMTVGLDVVLVLGQLPEERVAGAPAPTPEEFELFVAAVRDMESRIRSQVNLLLQGIPATEYGSPETLTTIKECIRESVNDALDGLNFGPGLRQGIGKRRVTEVLLPMFVRQYM